MSLPFCSMLKLVEPDRNVMGWLVALVCWNVMVTVWPGA
jgi:hypothetical protein